MGVKLNFFNVILVILFVIGIVISGFLLYNLPDSLLKQTLVLNIQDMKSITPVLSKINIAVGATLIVGLTAIIVLLFSKNSESEANLESRAEKNKNNESTSDNFQMDDEEEDKLETKEYERLFDSNLSVEDLSTQCLTILCKQLEASQGALYFTNAAKGQRLLELKGSYAYILADSQVLSYEFGEGLVGQAAKTGKTTHVKDVPQGYIQIFSGLGKSEPGELLIIPLKNNMEIVAVAELATFKPFSKKNIRIAEKACALFSTHFSKSKTSKSVEKEDKKS